MAIVATSREIAAVLGDRIKEVEYIYIIIFENMKKTKYSYFIP